MKQGCNMSGLLFLLVVNCVMRSTLQESNNRVRWKITKKPEVFDFANDITLISSSKQHIQATTDELTHEAGKVELKVISCREMQAAENKFLSK